jgi:hypothetical protein
MTRLDRIEKGIEALQKSQLETEEQLKRTDEQLAKTDAQLASFIARQEKGEVQLAETKRILSGIGINLGNVAEEFFANSLQKNKKLGKVKFDAVALQLKGHKGKVQDEFDVVMYNGNSVGLVEVKHKVHPADVEQLMTRKLPNFKALFPAYSSADFYLGIAGMSIPQEVIEIAENEGIAVLRQVGDVLAMNENLKKF